MQNQRIFTMPAMLKNGAITLLLSTFIFVLTANVFSQRNDDAVLLTIGGQEITVSEFLAVYQKNNVEGEVLDRKSLEDYLELYINFRLKVREAEDLGLDTIPSFVNELKGYRDQLAKPYFVDEELNMQLLEQAYERKQWDVRASHILITLDQFAPPADTLEAYNRMMQIRSRIVDGGEDFNDVAAEVSEDPSARDMPSRGFQPARKGNKGDIGYFSVFDMVFPFEEATYNLQVGEVSMPVRTQFGYHLIKLQNKMPALGRVQVAHLFLQNPQTPDEEKSLHLKSKADSLYGAVKADGDWDELVRKFSDDKSSSTNGGILPWFGSNRMVPQFVDGIRSISEEGQISEPIYTTYGWHIIKLVETKPVGSFEEEKDGLRQSLTRDMRANLSKESIIKSVKKEAGFKKFDKALAAFYNVVDSAIYSRNWEIEKAEKLTAKIAQLGNETYTQQEFAAYLAANQSINQKETIEQFVDRSFEKFIEDRVIAYKDARLEAMYPEFRALVNEYRDGILLFELTDQKVWSKAIRDTTGLKEFFENNRDKYMWEQRLDAILITSSTKQGAEKAHSMAEKRMSIDQMKEAFQSDEKHDIIVTERLFEAGNDAIIDKVEWSKGVSPVINDTDARFGFAVVRGVVEPQHKTLSEARGIITADYQNYLEQNWLKELRKKYTVVVNQDVLSSIK
jgi:peptidyl-prolyl cis-trans isomerase SurA